MKKKVPTEQEIVKMHGVSLDYVVRQAEIGSTVEREHTTSHEEAYGIALQHIAEFPNYYQHLLKMEKKLKKEWDNGSKKKTYKEMKEYAKLRENHIAVAMGKEMDDEGNMILTQLDQLEMHCRRLREVISSPTMQVPAWVQSKVTLATDYMDAVANYMSSKNEEVVYEAKEEKKEDEKKFCRLCQKPEKRSECSYGEKAWDRFAVPIKSVKK